MALFGKPKFNRGIGQTGQTPGIGDGMSTRAPMGGLPLPPQPFEMPAFDPQPKKKGGAFSKNGIAWKILGGLGDAFSDGPPIFTQSLLARQKEEQDLQQRQQQQEAENARWYEREQWKAQNQPKNPHRWESNDGSLMELDPTTGQPRVVYKDPTPKIQWVRVEDGNGTVTMVPVGQGGAQAPVKPVGQLRPYGGPTAPQSGGFR